MRAKCDKLLAVTPFGVTPAILLIWHKDHIIFSGVRERIATDPLLFME